MPQVPTGGGSLRARRARSSRRVSCRARRWPRCSLETMRRLRYALWPAGLAFGVAAEWAGRPQFMVLDAATGFALLFLGVVAWSRRPGSRAGAIMAAAGFAWFLGTLWAPALFWHRGPLAQLLISYPIGRLSSRLQRVGTVVASGYAAAVAVAGSAYATVVFALGLVALSA